MKKIDIVSAALLIVGGLNWGLVAVANFDLVATIFGAFLPTLVAAFVIAPLRHQTFTGDRVKLLAVGLLVNAAWGLGTAVLYRLFRRGRR